MISSTELVARTASMKNPTAEKIMALQHALQSIRHLCETQTLYVSIGIASIISACITKAGKHQTVSVIAANVII
jgi:arginine repressor